MTTREGWRQDLFQHKSFFSSKNKNWIFGTPSKSNKDTRKDKTFSNTRRSEKILQPSSAQVNSVTFLGNFLSLHYSNFETSFHCPIGKLNSQLDFLLLLLNRFHRKRGQHRQLGRVADPGQVGSDRSREKKNREKKRSDRQEKLV